MPCCRFYYILRLEILALTLHTKHKHLIRSPFHIQFHRSKLEGRITFFSYI